MKNFLLSTGLLLLVQLISAQQKNISTYFPPAGKWDKRSATGNFDTAKLNEAIRFAISNESKTTRNMELSQKNTFGKEPFGEAIGLFSDRGDATGIVIHKGYIVAEWGEPARVDMTHSVTKSFLSTVVGLAVEKGLIRNVYDTVADYLPISSWNDSIQVKPTTPVFLFNSFHAAHNRQITWETMLRQTSDWEGTLWGKPDWADRPDKDSTKWYNRQRNKPGAVFEYNDVRVNALALATTFLWRRTLPQVLKEKIMDPIGASDSWHWEGYKNSYLQLDTASLLAVSGGGHWGGGMFINAYDMARFGWLTLNKGNWKGQQLIPQQWIEQSLTPTTANTGYGYMNYFLNTDKKLMPAAPASAYIHLGNGTNIIYVDAEHELVMVIRWLENNALSETVKKFLAALK